MKMKGPQYYTVPSKAEDEKGDAKESGHNVPDQGIGMVRTEVETKPEGSSQGEKLTRQKIHLYRRESYIQQMICLFYHLQTKTISKTQIVWTYNDSM